MKNPILYKKLNNFLYNMDKGNSDEDFKSEIVYIIEELQEEIEDLEGVIFENETEIEEIKEDRDDWKDKFQDLQYEYNELIK